MVCGFRSKCCGLDKTFWQHKRTAGIKRGHVARPFPDPRPLCRWCGWRACMGFVQLFALALRPAHLLCEEGIKAEDWKFISLFLSGLTFQDSGKEHHYLSVRDMTLGACGFEETIFLKMWHLGTFVSSEIVFGFINSEHCWPTLIKMLNV